MTDPSETQPEQAAPSPAPQPSDPDAPASSARRSGLLSRGPSWLAPLTIALVVILVGVGLWWFFIAIPQRELQTAREQYAKGLYADASATLSGILARNGGNRDALLELARVKAATGDSAGALALYARVLGAGGGSAEVLFEVAKLERLVGRTQAAAGHFRSAWEQDRGNVAYANELGKTLVSLGQGKQAGDLWVGLANQTSRPSAERKQLYVLAALAYRDGKLIPQAKAALQKGLVLSPKDAHLLTLQKSLK